ncbi:FkbM family methyltransferase [Pedobacter sp. ASV28]|uniref:FkbM family methyltransferase n=1 Tax=Pedobacter sp. ASV28 TaxID=2795123 RepID=UPI0018EAB0DF|nr:FkbM family methyltransferase [Pedobacter sp. ASV28]
MIKTLLKLLLRRSYYKGQYRLFNFFYTNGFLTGNEAIVSPLQGDFRIKCNPKTWIGAQITYLGEYEDYIKDTFKKHVSVGDTVLDIGANIGFHTLFFSTLVGNKGKVVAFEPVINNFNQLVENIQLNGFDNVLPINIALGNKNETLYINTAATNNNPGAYSLLDLGETKIECRVGDELSEFGSQQKIDFIKIDVEGYELFALQGLIKTIQLYKPKIVFEYDKNYQLKAGVDPNAIFDLLTSLDYSFHEVKRHAVVSITLPVQLVSADILALPI